MEPPRFPAGALATIRAAPGAPAVLTLPLPSGSPPFTYTWSRVGTSLDTRFTASDDAGGVRLTVTSAQTGDSGVYSLQASNGVGSSAARVRLEVSPDEAPTGDDPPTFLRRLQDLTVKVGTRTRFLVEIVSSTECKVTWYRNERRLLEAERVALARDGNYWCADVAAVSVDDAGRWTCTAENAGGRASCSAHLNVLVPKAYKRPEFVEELRALLTEQGTVSLECKVVGVPTPILRWFKDSREIKAGDVFALTANADDPTSLGTYTCEAVNCMGRAYSSSKVHVVGRAKSDSRPSSSLAPEPPPIFTKELEDQHAKVNEPLTLSCQIVVPPWPRTVVWYNKEGKIEASERYHLLEDGVGGYLLEVPSAEWPDEGEWKCVATSSGGRVGISTCFVTMDVPKNYRKPRFMENLQAVLTEEGLVSFECKVVGFPTPVLSWFKDGQELKPGDVYQLTGTNSLGSYCCIARNCMGQASSSAELTVEDIQNQLNEEEKLQLFSKNQAPKFVLGLKSVEAKIDEPFRFTVKVAIPPEPSVLWYRDDQPVDDSTRSHLGKEERGQFFLEIQNLEFLDQAEWKCVAMNDFGHSVTSCFLKLIIPRHYKKPRFLENLQAILSEEGAVNLECKVIGVPQPVLKWYKDGEELKPGDIHRIISGQDGTCCLGTYTCEAQNCMGIAASSASLLGFDDSMKAKPKKVEEQALQRNLSLSTIHEERTSQMYDTPVGDITLDDKGEISFSFDGKEVSVSLYETPDLTEEEALQIVEMYADQLSENVTEHNVVELPPLRFVKETSTSGNLLMEAIIIDVSPDYFASTEEDLRTEADVEDISVLDENGPPQLSLDQDVGGEDYLEKTMALLTDEKSDIPKKMLRKKSDSQKSGEDFFSLSREQSVSEAKRDDDTQIQSESELQSFASARSSSKQKSKASKPSLEEGQDSTEPTKTTIFQDEAQKRPPEPESPAVKPKRERRTSRSSRRSSSGSEKSFSKMKAEEVLQAKEAKLTETMEVQVSSLPMMSKEEFNSAMISISTVLSKVINDIQIIERDIILKSELMSSAATASRSLEIISSLISPLSEIQSIADATKESVAESKELVTSLLSSLPQSLKTLQQSLTMIEKCIEVESESRTLVKKTCVAFVETCGKHMIQVMTEISTVSKKHYLVLEERTLSEIDLLANDMVTILKLSADTIKAKNLLSEASEIKIEEPTFEVKHLRDTQKAIFELKSPVQSLLCIAESAETGKITDVAKVKSCDVILKDMSASIQDLQTALEQIESLSVKEVTAVVHKYNTEIIETVMESVLKLRGSFEQLTIETSKEEDREVLKRTLVSIKENLSEISTHINTIERNVGPLDILQSDNKLEVLQKMAQILIALENNIPKLESLPEIKTHFDTFHKNLTKVLENVIESNEAKKYFNLMEICDAVNRINTSIKTIDADSLLSLASLGNTLRIIQDHFILNIFESDLNCLILSNITDVLVGIQEAINQAEEISMHINSEHIHELSSKEFEVSKAKVIVEHIEQTIAAISKVKTLETSQELKLALQPALENICPILEELKRYVAVTKTISADQEEHISEISDQLISETLAAPLCELNHNIIVLNQMIMENIESIKDNSEVIRTIAEPLHDLNITLEVLQQDVISQYGEDLTPYEVSVNIASAVQNLQSCIVMIQEQAGVEGADDMSTLEDVSGIKTTAETIPEELLAVPTAEETAVEQGLESFQEDMPTMATAQALNKLNEHITVLQNPEIIDALDTLSEISDYSSLKSVALGLGELHAGIEEILHPVVMESSTELTNFLNTSKLLSIAEPMQELQQCLSVLDINNIPIYENILEMSAGRIHSVFESITQFKEHLGKCLEVVYPAMETADKTIEISNKVESLREACEHMKQMIETTKAYSSGMVEQRDTFTNLELTVDGLLDATDVSKGIKLDEVKCLSQELYEKILTIQEELIQFTPLAPEKLAQEAKIIQTISDVEQNIAVLEQFDFVDLSKTTDLTSCMSPQLALELESDSLMQMDDVVENAVNILQDASNETPLADLMIVEDFFKSCKCEFTILRCLVMKQMTHKKIIRVLQEFISLQTSITDFKIKSSELNLSQDIRNSLETFMIHANDCLNNVQDSLLNIIDAQSEVLFKTPMSKIKTTSTDLKENIKAETSSVVKEIIMNLVSVLEGVQPSFEHTESIIAEEIKNPSEIRPRVEESIIIQKMEEMETYLEKHISAQTTTSHIKQVLIELLNCVHKHQDYKDAIGTGKSLIAVKCLAECSDIIQENLLNKKITAPLQREMDVKEGVLKTLLTEMLEPLQAFHGQLKNVQKQILTGVEEKSISFDISTTESFVQTMTEIHKEIAQIEQKIVSEGSLVDNEDISLIMEVDKEIHTIQDSLKHMDVPLQLTTPIEEIEKTLHTILASDVVSAERDKLITERAPEILQHIEKYISEDIIEIVEEITAIIKIDELKQSLDLARELQQNIITVNTVVESETAEVISEHLTAQAELVQQLVTALTVVQVQALQSAEELSQSIEQEALDKVYNAMSKLHSDLSTALTTIPVEISADVKELVLKPEKAEVVKEKKELQAAKIIVAEKSFDSDKTVIEKVELETVTTVTQVAATEEVTVVKKIDDEREIVQTAQVSKVIEPEITGQIAIEELSVTKADAVIREQKDAGEQANSADTLTKHIEQYISDEVASVVRELAMISDNKLLTASINLASELYEKISSENVPTELKAEPLSQIDILTVQVQLVEELKEALSTVQSELSQVSSDSLPSVGDISKIAETIEQLQTDLATFDILSAVVKETEISKEIVSETNLSDTKHSVKDTDIITIKDEIGAEMAQTTDQANVVKYSTDGEEKYIVDVLDEEPPVLAIKQESARKAKLGDEETEVLDITTQEDQPTLHLLQHIEEFTSKEITEAVVELSTATQIEELNQTVAIARELREKIEACKAATVIEQTGEITEELKAAQADVAHQLQTALTVLQETVFNTTQELQPTVSAEALQKVSEAIVHLQEDLANAACTVLAIKVPPEQKEDDFSVESGGESTMKRLENLLQEVSDRIDQSATDKDAESTESLRDSLDEVQTVIIKLRRDYDGAENDTLNETLEDLECSVRSVQLQINEDSPPELLKEACATLQLLVNNMSETQEVHISENIGINKETNKADKMLEKCSDETQETVDLLNVAMKLNLKESSSNMQQIISNLNSLRETMKSLRLSFLGNAESLIERGIEVNQNLEQIEDKVYLLERELGEETNVSLNIRDSILTAIHSVFGSISNMRGTIMSIQKQYMYENYGKPSESILKSVKNLHIISHNEKDVDLQSKIKSFSNSLRKMLVHFEDIKFYVNLDKTARIPSDSDLTKCVLEEIKHHIAQAILPQLVNFDPITADKIENLVQCVETNLLNIDSRSTLEVKEKIPIFKNIAYQVLDVTELIKSQLKTKSIEKIILGEEQTLEKGKEIVEEPREGKQARVAETEAPLDGTLEALISIDVEKEEQHMPEENLATTEYKKEAEIQHEIPVKSVDKLEPEPSTSGQLQKEITSEEIVELISTIETKEEQQSNECIPRHEKVMFLEKASNEITEKIPENKVEEVKSQLIPDVPKESEIITTMEEPLSTEILNTDMSKIPLIEEKTEAYEQSLQPDNEMKSVEKKITVKEAVSDEQPSTSKQAMSKLKEEQDKQKREAIASEIEVPDNKLAPDDIAKISESTRSELNLNKASEKNVQEENESNVLQKKNKLEKEKRKKLEEELGLQREEDEHIEIVEKEVEDLSPTKDDDHQDVKDKYLLKEEIYLTEGKLHVRELKYDEPAEQKRLEIQQEKENEADQTQKTEADSKTPHMTEEATKSQDESPLFQKELNTKLEVVESEENKTNDKREIQLRELEEKEEQSQNQQEKEISDIKPKEDEFHTGEEGQKDDNKRDSEEKDEELRLKKDKEYAEKMKKEREEKEKRVIEESVRIQSEKEQEEIEEFTWKQDEKETFMPEKKYDTELYHEQKLEHEAEMKQKEIDNEQQKENEEVDRLQKESDENVLLREKKQLTIDRKKKLEEELGLHKQEDEIEKELNREIEEQRLQEKHDDEEKRQREENEKKNQEKIALQKQNEEETLRSLDETKTEEKRKEEEVQLLEEEESRFETERPVEALRLCKEREDKEKRHQKESEKINQEMKETEKLEQRIEHEKEDKLRLEKEKVLTELKERENIVEEESHSEEEKQDKELRLWKERETEKKEELEKIQKQEENVRFEKEKQESEKKKEEEARFQIVEEEKQKEETLQRIKSDEEEIELKNKQKEEEILQKEKEKADQVKIEKELTEKIESERRRIQEIEKKKKLQEELGLQKEQDTIEMFEEGKKEKEKEKLNAEEVLLRQEKEMGEQSKRDQEASKKIGLEEEKLLEEERIKNDIEQEKNKNEIEKKIKVDEKAELDKQKKEKEKVTERERLKEEKIEEESVLQEKDVAEQTKKDQEAAEKIRLEEVKRLEEERVKKDKVEQKNKNELEKKRKDDEKTELDKQKKEEEEAVEKEQLEKSKLEEERLRHEKEVAEHSKRDQEAFYMEQQKKKKELDEKLKDDEQGELDQQKKAKEEAAEKGRLEKSKLDEEERVRQENKVAAQAKRDQEAFEIEQEKKKKELFKKRKDDEKAELDKQKKEKEEAAEKERLEKSKLEEEERVRQEKEVAEQSKRNQEAFDIEQQKKKKELDEKLKDDDQGELDQQKKEREEAAEKERLEKSKLEEEERVRQENEVAAQAKRDQEAFEIEKEKMKKELFKNRKDDEKAELDKQKEKEEAAEKERLEKSKLEEEERVCQEKEVAEQSKRNQEALEREQQKKKKELDQKRKEDEKAELDRQKEEEILQIVKEETNQVKKEKELNEKTESERRRKQEIDKKKKLEEELGLQKEQDKTKTFENGEENNKHQMEEQKIKAAETPLCQEKEMAEQFKRDQEASEKLIEEERLKKDIEQQKKKIELDKKRKDDEKAELDNQKKEKDKAAETERLEKDKSKLEEERLRQEKGIVEQTKKEQEVSEKLRLEEAKRLQEERLKKDKEPQQKNEKLEEKRKNEELDKRKKDKEVAAEKENLQKEECLRQEKELAEQSKVDQIASEKLLLEEQKRLEEERIKEDKEQQKKKEELDKKLKDEEVAAQKRKKEKEKAAEKERKEKIKLEEEERVRQEKEKAERTKRDQEASEKIRLEEEKRLKEERIKKESQQQKKKEESEQKRKEDEKAELDKQKKVEEKRSREKRLKKEKEELKQKEEKEAAERKQKEKEKAKLDREKKDEEKNLREEKENQLRKDRESKKKKELDEKRQREEEAELKRKELELEEKRRKLDEKNQKEESKEETRLKREKERIEKKKSETNKQIHKKENGEVIESLDSQMYTKNYQESVNVQAEGHREGTSYIERSRTEDHRTKTFPEHKDEVYSSERRHREDKERPTFVDHNHSDYTMEFARPSGYRERTTDINVLYLDGGAHDRNGSTIYKASTLVQQAQLRSSLPPPVITRTSDARISDTLDRRSEVRHRTKAVSEARSILSEKRSTTRDSRRKPVFSTFLTDRTAVEGSRVKLTCSVLSATDPNVSWFRNGLPLDNKMKYKTKLTDGLITLEVLNAVPTDSAEYSCVVENENGSISTSANLKVYPSFEASPIPPTFTRSIRDNYHLAENELVLECRIRGQPLPTITWLKDDSPVASDRCQAFYLADGVCRLAISSPVPEDSGKYTCKAENSLWSDQITHVVNFTGTETRLSSNIATVERSRYSRQSLESRRPHFSNVLADHTVPHGGTIGLQVEIKGAPSRVEWLREGRSVLESYRNARTFVEQCVYTLALTDVTEHESGTYTCRAFGTHGTVDMNASITVVPHGGVDGKPAIIVGRPEKDVLISVGEDLNISFRVQGEPKPKVVFMKGTRDITNSQRVCKMTSDDYVKFTLKRSVVSDAGTYCILARNAYGVDRAFVTVVIRQHASSEHLVSDWTYPLDDSALSLASRSYKAVPERIPSEPNVVDGGANWVSLAWPKPDPQGGAPVLAYKVESWQIGKEGGARWVELGITPLTSYDIFNLKQGEEYHFRVTPRNRYGWGESVQTSKPVGIGSAGDRPEFTEILPGQLKVLVGQKACLTCSVKGNPLPEIVWMKNGHEVDEEGGRVSVSFNGHICSLTIDGITVDDEARYSCEATNEQGRASTYARLAVVTDRVVWEADAKLKRERSNSAGDGEYPPQFTMRLRDRRVQATYPVRLTCQVVGSPTPSVTWFKDGLQIAADLRHTKSQDEHFHTIEIAPTTLEDGGVYEALARNSRGAVSCRCSLVVDKGIRAYVAPEFCLGLDPVYRLTEGEELRISAVVEAYPSVGVTWYRDGVRLRPSRRAIMTLDRDGVVELALAAVCPRDAGVYTCTASNEVGRASTSGKVEVMEGDQPVDRRRAPMVRSPDVPYSKEPMFVRKPRSSEAYEADTVIIQCEVVGDPKPDVYWLRDFLKPDYYRDASHFKRIGDGPEYRFEIPHAKLDYTGAYSVVAKNTHGEAKAVISLQILARDPESTSDAHNVRYGRVDVIPRFQRELTDLLCCDGDAIEFECQLAGEPEPDVRWFRYGELIRECEDFSMSHDGSTARLKIKQVTAEDEGMYACEASNNLGKATSTACLVVYAPGEPNTLSRQLRRPPALLSAQSTPRSTPRCTPARSVSRTPGPETRRQIYSPSRQVAPRFYTYPVNKVVEEGATVVFQCAVTGHPSPWSTWDKDGVIITPSARITIKEKEDVRLIEVEEVTIEDAGLYRITLENDYGRVEAVARLDVISHRGKFCSGVRAYSASPRRTTAYRKHIASTSTRQTDMTQMTEYRLASPGIYKLANCPDLTLDEYQTLQNFFDRIPEGEENNIFFSEIEEDDEDENVPRVNMPDEVTVKKGRSLRLKASIADVPNLKIMWLKDDEEININEAKWDRFNIEVHPDNTILEISTILEGDEGLYTVNAVNNFGIALCDARVTIDDALERYGGRNDVTLKDVDDLAVTINCESHSELLEILEKIERGQVPEDMLANKYGADNILYYSKDYTTKPFVETFSDSSRLLWQIKINKRCRA